MNKVDRDRSHKAGPGRAVVVIAAVLAAMLAGPAAAEDAKTIAATVCVACHAGDGNSVIPMFPKIAGLQEEYIVKQLKDFMSGRRKSDIMAPVVAALKAEDVAPLATYFSSQKMKAGEAEDKKAVALGKLIFHDGNEETGVPACVGCHQPEGVGHVIYPRIGGQHATYVAQQLKNFAAGERNNDVSRYMRVTAKRLSEEEINAVAQYIAGLGAK
ncbi:MAG: c-type cytochrome [Betaproteobacteria bacterium]|nr:c-type cytochrome [Rhodocyclales bacterium]